MFMGRILMVASEAVPFVKTGGLGDVIGALPAALQAGGEEVAVILPRYRDVALDAARPVYHDLGVQLGPAHYRATIHEVARQGVRFLLVDCPPLYDRDGIYGNRIGDFPDNDVRYALLAHAALAVSRHLFRPQILHCHDWQAGLVALYLRRQFATDPTFFSVRTLFTIHNLGYQGLFGRERLGAIGLADDVIHRDSVELHGHVSLLKAGLVESDQLSTVSPTYAREIQTPEYGFGLEDVLHARAAELTGILNGADYEEWNPATDRHVAARYSAADPRGKARCKRDLLETFGLPAASKERPLIGIVSRFASQKGFDLIAEIIAELLAEELSLVVLGSGEKQYEELFTDFAAAYPDKIGVRIAWDNGLAHKIEAGSDMFLMPSRYEPCGLNQIYSLRYGSVPIVRATGGLDDTIEEGTGFKFSGYTGSELLFTVRQALAAFEDKDSWQALMRRGMRKDFSWNASAAGYSALYRRMLGPASKAGQPG